MKEGAEAGGETMRFEFYTGSVTVGLTETVTFEVNGSVGSVLFYPEFFFRVAPKISGAAHKVEERVKERVIGK